MTVEPAKNSEAFFSYGIYIAAITTNKSLIKSWILNNEIKIVDERILNEELYISKETVETNLDTVHH